MGLADFIITTQLSQIAKSCNLNKGLMGRQDQLRLAVPEEKTKMTNAELFTQYLEHLFVGKRCEARELLFSAHDRGISASKLIKSIIWPAMEQVDNLYRSHQITRITEHMATRINRTIADQLAGFLAREPKTGKRMVITCGREEIEELGAQMVADLFESKGWSVWFLGSGVPSDEVLQFVGSIRPDILCVYGAEPQAVPELRMMIELVRHVSACDQMQVLMIGGVFKRAEGLSEEIKADLFAPDVKEAMKIVDSNPVRIPRPDVPEPGRRRKRKHRASSSARIRRVRVAIDAD